MFSTWNVVPRRSAATAEWRGYGGWELGDGSLTSRFSFLPDTVGVYLDILFLFVGSHDPLERLDGHSLLLRLMCQYSACGSLLRRSISNNPTCSTSQYATLVRRQCYADLAARV